MYTDLHHEIIRVLESSDKPLSSKEIVEKSDILLMDQTRAMLPHLAKNGYLRKIMPETSSGPILWERTEKEWDVLSEDEIDQQSQIKIDDEQLRRLVKETLREDIRVSAQQQRFSESISNIAKLAKVENPPEIELKTFQEIVAEAEESARAKKIMEQQKIFDMEKISENFEKREAEIKRLLKENAELRFHIRGIHEIARDLAEYTSKFC